MSSAGERRRFGPFVVDFQTGELWRDGSPVPIQDLPLRALQILIEVPGQLVTRGDLIARLWGTDTHVDATAGVNTAVAKLREALGDNPEQPVYIETVPRRGYRFVGVLAASHEARNGASTGHFLARPLARRWAVAVAVVAVGLVVVVAVSARRFVGAPIRVAVALFDNETSDGALERVAQLLTDETVTVLTARSRLAVVGNAAVLRTTRPFRDLGIIRDSLHADYIVIGQIQRVDGRTLVRTHLIRGEDQTHVWVREFSPGNAEHDFLHDVADQVAGAVDAAVASRR